MAIEDVGPDDFENDSQPNYREKAPTIEALDIGFKPSWATIVPASTALAKRPVPLSPLAEQNIRKRRLRTEAGRASLLQMSMDAGRELITCAGIEGMAGSFTAQYPTCPHCQTVIRREIRNPFLERLVELFTGQPRIVWAVTMACDDCLARYEANTDKARAERRRLALERCGFSKAMITWTFDTYPQQGSDWLKRARDYVSAGAPHDVILWGNPGVGKTGLGIAILRTMFDDGKTVRFLRATELMLMLRDAMTPKGFEGQSELDVIQSIAAVDYLMIDDLSQINGTEYQDEIMSLLIDLRQKENRPTLLTLNLRVGRGGDPSRMLMNFFGDRVFDRLREYGEEWHMMGHSMRKGR
jgi:DNA replication protein DnaC